MGIDEMSLEEIFDHLVERSGFRAESPEWTEPLIRLHAHSLTRRLHVIPEHFYTPVFSPSSLREEVWSESFTEGVLYDADAQVRLIAEVQKFGNELEEFEAECPSEPDQARRFFWNNGQFGHGDAVFYYSLIRSLKPRRVVEVGAGFSTLLSSEAVARNGIGSIVSVEPYPRPFLLAGLAGVVLRRQPVQEAPGEIFEELGDGDILFIDGSHVCKTGSDVNHLFLRVLPRLQKGVWVHIHDIFLPFEYPRQWVEQLRYWNEGYVLAALLCHSRKFELAMADYFLWRTARERLVPLMPGVPGLEPGGSSFWIRCIS